MRENASDNFAKIRAFVEENARASRPFVLLPLKDKRPTLPKWPELDTIPPEAWDPARVDSVGVRTGRTARGILLCIDIDTKDAATAARVNKAIAHAGAVHGYPFPTGSIYAEDSANGSHVFILTEPAPSGVQEYRKQKLINDPTTAKGSSGYSVELIAEGGQVKIYPSDGREPTEGGTLLNLSAVTPRAVVETILTELTGAHEVKEAGAVPASRRPLSQSSCAPSHSNGDDPAQYLRDNPETVGRYLRDRDWWEIKDDGKYWYFQRPDTPDKSPDNHSITIAHNGGAVYVWSSCLRTPSGPASPLSFIANEFHGGDARAASRDLIRRDYCPPRSQSSCDIPADRFDEFDAYEETTEPEAAPEVPTKIEEREPKASEGAALFTDIEGAISYGCAHLEELETILPPEIYQSSDTIRRLIDSISPEDTPARIGYFSAAWTLCGFLLGGSVYEEHYADGAKQDCSTSQYTFLFAPSGSGKNTCKKFLQSCCDRYNVPFVDRAQKAKEAAERDHSEALKEWEATPKGEKRPPRPIPPKLKGIPRACISQPVSAPALVNDWARTDGKMLVCVDEARDSLKAMTAKDARNYCAGILTLYREAFTAERGSYSAETSQTERKDGGGAYVRIDNPCLNTFYCGVPPTDWKALASCAEDGTFGRFNFFFFRPKPDRKIKITVNRPASEGHYFTQRGRLIDTWADRAKNYAGEPSPEDRGQCITWTEEAAEMLGRYTEEANRCAARWGDRSPAFAAIVGHSPLRYAKAALLYAVIDYQGEDLRTAKINAEACQKAYRFMLYQFAQLMHIYDLRGGQNNWGEIVKRLASYAAEVVPLGEWWPLAPVYAAGFRVDGWGSTRKGYAAKLKEIAESGTEPIEWNRIDKRGCKFRIVPEGEPEAEE